MTNSQMENAVAKGVEFLDSKVPNWKENIKWDDLHVGSSETCILAQLAEGSYTQGRSIFGVTNPYALGFHLPSGEDSNADYEALTELWRKQASVRELVPA